MQIKVRVWDNVEKRYRKLGSEHDVFETFEDGTILYHNYQNGAGGAECEAELFTGLIDKNGKKIYEGDIVSHDQIVKPGFPIERDNFGFAIGNDWTLSDLAMMYDLSELEVIGNVRENPELLV